MAADQQIALLTQQVQSSIQAHDQLREASRSTTVVLEHRLVAIEAPLATALAQDFPCQDGPGDRLKPFVEFKKVFSDTMGGGAEEQFQA